MFKRLRDYRLIPSVEHVEEKDALNIAGALVDAGLPVLELQYRNHGDARVIRAILKEYPDFLIGVGGILNGDLVMRSCEAGARFLTSPGVDPDIIAESEKHGCDFAPGFCTPTELMAALVAGMTNLMFFPAGYFGGPQMVDELLEPFEHLNLEVIVKGGITKENVGNYLRIPAVAAVSCPWIIEDGVVQDGRWSEIRKQAEEAVALCDMKKTIYF